MYSTLFVQRVHPIGSIWSLLLAYLSSSQQSSCAYHHPKPALKYALRLAIVFSLIKKLYMLSL
jgi:hypothetical protein